MNPLHPLLLAGALTASTVLAGTAAAATPTCVASGVVFGGNDGSTFAVQNRPVNERGIGMRAEPDGLHLSLTKPAQDADVIVYSTTLGAVIDHGVGVEASGNTFTNLWFDTNKDGRFFDLAKNGTGTFTSVAGDDYGTLGKDTAGKLTVSALGGATLTRQNELLTALDTDTAGKINRDTRVAIDVGINSPATAGLVTAVAGKNVVTCTTPTVTAKPTATATATATPTAAPTSTLVLPPLTTSRFTQTGVIPAGAPATGAE